LGRYLLASDDARTRIGIAGALEREGHRVDRVTHLQLAAQHADLSEVDAVVVGLEQPLRRERFIERVRARNSRVPVIVLLDSHTAGQANRLQSHGVTVVLTRPLKVAELVQHLERLAPALRPAMRGPIQRPRSRTRTAPALV
jgi:DNA-binding response OmpR family regulator